MKLTHDTLKVEKVTGAGVPDVWVCPCGEVYSNKHEAERCADYHEEGEEE